MGHTANSEAGLRAWLGLLAAGVLTMLASAPAQAATTGPDGQAAEPQPAAARAEVATPWLAPDGGWLAEFEVHFSGDYQGTLADPPDHPLRAALAVVRNWAREQGLALHWYGQAGLAEAQGLLAAHDPQELGIDVTRVGLDWKARQNQLPRTITYPSSGTEPAEPQQATLDLALTEGTETQRDSLRRALLAVPGVRVIGAWPRSGYLFSRYPATATPRQLTIAGKAYQWPADFSPVERLALQQHISMVTGGTGHPWYGDMYYTGDPLSQLTRLGLGPIVRFRYRDSGLSIDSPDPQADLSGLQLASWQYNAYFSVEAPEAELPFKPGEMLINASRTNFAYSTQSFNLNDALNLPGWRAVVDLPSADPAATEQRLDQLLADWQARYPELGPGGPLAGAVSSGPVKAAGGQPQWQATLWLKDATVVSRLADYLQEQGIRLAAFTPLRARPDQFVMASGPGAGANWREDRSKFPWTVSFRLAPDDPHGFDSAILARRLGDEGLARLRTERDALRADFKQWLVAQGQSAADAEAQLWRFSGHEDSLGVAAFANIAMPDQTSAAAVQTALARPGQPAPQVFNASRSLGDTYYRGMILSWELVPPAVLRGQAADPAGAQLPPALLDAAAQTRHALEDALQAYELAQGIDVAPGAPRPLLLADIKFGPVTRRVDVMTAYAPGPELDALEAALRRAVPGLPSATRRPGFNFNGSSSGENQQQDAQAQRASERMQRELLRVPLLAPPGLSSFTPEELSQVLTATDLQTLAARRAQVDQAVQNWNAQQLPEDRVTVEPAQVAGPAVTLVVLGDRPELDNELSLAQALELPGLPPYEYGMGFVNRASRSLLAGPTQHVPGAALVFHLVPTVYWEYSLPSAFHSSASLRQFYTAEQLQQLRQMRPAFENALATWVAGRSDLRLLKPAEYPRDGAGVVAVKPLMADDVPLTLQVSIHLADEAARQAALKELDAFLHQAVPGLPQSDTSRGYTEPF